MSGAHDHPPGHTHGSTCGHWRARDPWPEKIEYDPATKTLHVVFETGETLALTAEYLRVESPSAEVQGHSPSQKQTVPGKRNVGIRRIESVGNYAVRLVFDDGHDTGLYTWRYLYELGHEHDARWTHYLEALGASGLTRER